MQFWRRQWHLTPALLPGKSHGWRSLVGCSPWGREESDTTEQLHFHFSLSCIGEGNGNPLQCSCLENPRDGEAWWAAVSGVAQNQTRLKRLSSSSSSSSMLHRCLVLYVSCPLLMDVWNRLHHPCYKGHWDGHLHGHVFCPLCSCILDVNSLEHDCGTTRHVHLNFWCQLGDSL